MDDKNEVTFDYPTSKEVWRDHFKYTKAGDNRIDAIVDMLESVQLSLAQASSRAEYYKSLEDKWQASYGALQDYAFWLLNNEPEHEYAGTKSYLQARIATKPNVRSSVRRSFTAHNVIPNELIFSVPEKYRTCKVLWLLDEGLIRDDLLAGKSLSFAELLYKPSLHIKPKLSELNQ